MANLTLAVATGLRTVRTTFSAALTDFGSGATGALNPDNWTFLGQVTAPVPVAAVVAVSVAEISTTVIDITVDDDLSPGQTYQVTAKAAVDGGITGVAASPNNRAAFVAVPLTPPAERDFGTLGLVPKMNLREDSTQELERFLRVLDDVLQLQLDRVDSWTDIFDSDLAPENFLDLQLQDLAYPLNIALAEIDKRRLLSVLVTLYKQKGTIDGLKNAIRFFLGYESDILSPNWSLFGGWVLGDSDLDVDTVLGSFFYSSTLHGSDMVVFDGAQVFSFWVKVGTPSAVALTTDEDTKVRAIIEVAKPAHTHLAGLSANLPPPQNVTATAGSGTITLAWDAVTGATEYAIFYSTTPAVSALSPLGYIDPDNASPFVDTVPSGQTRYYVVCARVAGINGVSSKRVNATAA